MSSNSSDEIETSYIYLVWKYDGYKEDVERAEKVEETEDFIYRVEPES